MRSIAFGAVFCEATMKTCTKCGESKALSEYHKDGRFGLKAVCNKCRAAKERKYYEANKEKIAAKAKKYREENKEKIAAGYKKWYEANKEKKAATHKKWYEANKEKIAAWQKKYGQENKEKIAAGYKKWREENKEKIAARDAKRSAIKAGLPGHFTAAEFTAICEKYNNRCLCCGKKNKLEADHVIPITWKGSTNYIENIQPLCKSCNSGKRNHHATDYRI